MLDTELTYRDLCALLSGLSSESDPSSLSAGCEAAACLHELHLCGLADSLPSVFRFPPSRLWCLFGVAAEFFSLCEDFVGRCDLLYGLYLLWQGAVDGFDVPLAGSDGPVAEAAATCSTGLSALLDEYPGAGGGALPMAAIDRVLVTARAPYGASDARADRLLAEHLRFYAASQRGDGSWCLDAPEGAAAAFRRLEVLHLYERLSGDWTYEDVLRRGASYYGTGGQDTCLRRALHQVRALSDGVFSSAEALAVV